MGGSKRNHVIKKALQEFAEPPVEDECICKAFGSRGSNKIDVELPDGHRALVILPAKFHKKIWIRKGSYVIVKAIEDSKTEGGERFFNGEIVRVLLKDDEKHLKSLEGPVWPERFCDGSTVDDGYTSEEEEGEEEEDLPEHLRRVENRKIIHYIEEDDSEDDSE